jgi:hypothetical protein
MDLVKARGVPLAANWSIVDSSIAYSGSRSFCQVFSPATCKLFSVATESTCLAQKFE